jgi:hypothetical protein
MIFLVFTLLVKRAVDQLLRKREIKKVLLAIVFREHNRAG